MYRNLTWTLALKILFTSAALLGAPLALSSPPDKLPNYDEVFDSHGKVRPQYKDAYAIYSGLGDAQKAGLSRQATDAFKNDNALHLFPRILTQTEYSGLKAGIEQRATALKMFFEDHFSGNKAYAKNDILPASVVKQITQRHGEEDWTKFVDPGKLNWLYGPDIVRLESGKFAVVEDNFGYMGGFGDLIKAREALYNAIPEYRAKLDSPDPEQFYRNLISRYHERAPTQDGITVLLQYERANSSDNEDSRIERIFKKLGAEAVSIPLHDPVSKKAPRKLVVTEDGVYLETWKHGQPVRTKVAFVIANMDVVDIDGSHPAAKKQILLEEAREQIEEANIQIATQLQHKNELINYLKSAEIDFGKLEAMLLPTTENAEFLAGKYGVPGLMNAALSGIVGLNYTPGLGFAEDKEFYTYVDSLIRFYLKQEPLLESIKTRSFRTFKDGNPLLDEQALEEVFGNSSGNIKNYVVKGVAGMGGKEVYIGTKMTSTEIGTLKEMILKNPALYIFQEYHNLSVMTDHLVDLRCIAEVGIKTGDVMVSKTPWGRAVPLSGDGKVNISANGKETTVLVVPDPVDCNQLLQAP